MEWTVLHTHRSWVAILAMLMALTVVGGCGDPVRSKYSTREVFDRYDNNGVEREGYAAPEEMAKFSGDLDEDGPFDFGHSVAFALKNAPQVIEGAVQLQLEDLSIEERYARMFPEFRVRMTVSSVIFLRQPLTRTTMTIKIKHPCDLPFQAAPMIRLGHISPMKPRRF